jgi:hypothetical protein
MVRQTTIKTVWLGIRVTPMNRKPSTSAAIRIRAVILIVRPAIHEIARSGDASFRKTKPLMSQRVM